MKVSDHFGLNKTQKELDFVDVDISTDTPLFLDPYFLSIREDPWSKKATATLRDFFQSVVNLIKANNINEAEILFDHLHEPDETFLGLSENESNGKGVGKGDTKRMFKRIVKSQAIQSGLVQHLEDTAIFVDRIGKDKLSDMATNILRKHLIEYTQRQCKLWNIPLTSSCPTGYYWDVNTKMWNNEYSNMLLINGQSIILVPKAIVSYNSVYTSKNYHQHFILNFLQQEHLRLRSALVEVRRTKKGITRKVTKKNLVDKVAPYDKEFIRSFTISHPTVYETFKLKMKSKQEPLDLKSIESFNYRDFASHLKEELIKIPIGAINADNYHHFIIGVLHFLLYPNLINPEKEVKIHDGRKRIDITFDNSAEVGFFKNLHMIDKIPCSYIMIECKNYNSDPVNPELDQLAGRFGVNRGKFGILMCRSFENEKLFIKRCRDTFTDDRGLIIPITDLDLIEVLDSFSFDGNNSLEKILSKKKKDIIL